MKISLVITTYNWPQALAAVLDSVRLQTLLPLEILIADDGSSDETRQLIRTNAEGFPCPIQHVWQEDNGFQAAAIRNKAASRAKGCLLHNGNRTSSVANRSIVHGHSTRFLWVLFVC